MLFNFAIEYAIRRVQANQDSLKLNVTHQLLVYADDVNILGGSIHTVKENAEGLTMLIKLSTWSCLEIRMQDEVTILGLTIDPLQGWNSSNIWEQP